MALTRVLPAWTSEPACCAATERERVDTASHGGIRGMLNEGQKQRTKG